MPRYFFRVEPAGVTDPDGEELPGPAAAQEMARLMARELSTGKVPTSADRIVVSDEAGNVIHDQPMSPVAQRH